MRVMTDTMLERTICFLVTMYINRKIAAAEAIIKRGGRPLMNFKGKLGKLSLTIAVMETKTVTTGIPGDQQNPMKTTESDPYKVFDLNLNMEGQETEQDIQMEELKAILDTGKSLISEGRDKLYVPLMGLFDKYLDRGAKLGETYAGKVMEGMRTGEQFHKDLTTAYSKVDEANKKLDDLSAQVAVVQDTVDKLPKQQ